MMELFMHALLLNSKLQLNSYKMYVLYRTTMDILWVLLLKRHISTTGPI